MVVKTKVKSVWEPKSLRIACSAREGCGFPLDIVVPKNHRLPSRGQRRVLQPVVHRRTYKTVYQPFFVLGTFALLSFGVDDIPQTFTKAIDLSSLLRRRSPAGGVFPE